MAKEFKEFDKVYSKYKGKLLAYEESDCNFDLHEAQAIKKWVYDVGMYTHEAVRYAVYLAESAQEWQKFRVSLKGFSTKEKLYRLMKRREWALKRLDDEDIEEDEAMLEDIRIDNYIGALRRANMLNAQMEVIK